MGASQGPPMGLGESSLTALVHKPLISLKMRAAAWDFIFHFSGKDGAPLGVACHPWLALTPHIFVTTSVTPKRVQVSLVDRGQLDRDRNGPEDPAPNSQHSVPKK